MDNNELIRLLENYQPESPIEKAFKQQIIDFIKNNAIIFGKKNPKGHITGSAWIINPEKDKALLTHHKKLDRWLQVGGHSEENENISDTAFREAFEETGLTTLKPLSKDIFDIDVHKIPQHKDDEAHYHYDIRFLLQADNDERAAVSDESKDIKWISLDSIKSFNQSDSILRMVEKTKGINLKFGGDHMKYAAYIFDFDYTLGDSTRGIVEATNYALSEMGFAKAAEDDIRNTVGMSLPEMFTSLSRNEEHEGRSQFSQLFKVKADEIMTESTELYKDTINVLSLLKSKGAKTGIVTTKYHYRIDQILSKFQITSLIDVIVGGDEVKNAKPHPEALLSAIEKLNESKENVLYIGDSIIDAKTAYGANVDFIGVTTGTTGRDEFTAFPRLAVIKALSELPSF